MTTAAALMLALACLPVVLDQCVASCDAHQAAVTTPPCHHTQSTGTQFSHAPTGCNHDHASVGAAQSASSVPQRTFDVVAVLSSPPVPAAMRLSRLVSTSAHPGSPGPIHASSLPLRI